MEYYILLLIKREKQLNTIKMWLTSLIIREIDVIFSLSPYSFMVIYFDCFLVLAIVINAAMNMGGGITDIFLR